MDRFQGQLVPDVFINQDADPFLWELYRRWDASRFADPARVTLRNGIGGDASTTVAPPPRYNPKHVAWKTPEVLGKAVKTAGAAIGVEPHLALDVVVPAGRCNEASIRQILALAPAPNTVTMFVVIIDPPRAASARTMDALGAMRRRLEDEFGPRVRIRVNPDNCGASATRNRGLDESAADWVIFLDDDVDVTGAPDLIAGYAKAIAGRGEIARAPAGPCLRRSGLAR